MQFKKSKGDLVLHGVGFLLTLLLCFLLVDIMFELYKGASLSIEKFGWHFLTSSHWSPATQTFGGLAPVVGTLATTSLAIMLALPLSLGISFFITNLSHAGLKSFLTLMIELLSVIPSIIFGLWGLLVFAPTLGLDITQTLAALLGHNPITQSFFSGGKVGMNIITASIVLSLMIIPFITVCFKEAFELVPVLLKEAAYGLGCTSWEVLRFISIPYTFRQLIGGIMLGVTRALGETMAVAFVIGNSHVFTTSLLEPSSTIASVLANEFNEAESKLHVSSLLYLGFLLFFITMLSITVSQLFLKRETKGL